MANPMPAMEIEIDESLVRSLLVDQAPELAELALRSIARGWDNSIYRLGADHLVRLPHREQAVALVRTEQRWLPALAQRLPLPIPTPVVAGRPTAAFPWPWSVVPYIDGDDAIDTRLGSSAAVVLAAFCQAMHQPAPPEAPENPFRGGPINARDSIVQTRRSTLAGWLDDRLDPGELGSAWQRAVDAAPAHGPAVWLHGDLHPGNVIVDHGRIVGVVDFGDLTSGDRATDLGSAWMFFDQPERDRYRRELVVDDDTWDRARGWAIHVGLAIAENSADHPRYEALAERILRRAAADSS